jgi:hypothetical protein
MPAIRQVGRHVLLFRQVALSDGLHLESEFAGRFGTQPGDAVALRKLARSAWRDLIAFEALTKIHFRRLDWFLRLGVEHLHRERLIAVKHLTSGKQAEERD